MIGLTTAFLEWILSFCTDRRMTAYVLGTKPTLVRDKDEDQKGVEGGEGEKVRANNNTTTAFASPILQTGNDAFEYTEINFRSRYR